MSIDSFKVTTELVGAHVHMQFRYGQEGQRALLGVLTMRPEQAKDLLNRLDSGFLSDVPLFTHRLDPEDVCEIPL